MDLTELATLIDSPHSRMVGSISGLLAGYAGYSPEEAAVIEQAARLHDAGKIDIPPEVLNKPGPLTEQEYAVVKTHTRLGAEKIKVAARSFFAAIVIAEQHHERCDGGGYLGLHGADIHPLARLVAVSDVYDALVSRRPYKEPRKPRDACAYIKERAGTQFASDIAALFLAHGDEVLALYQS